MLKRVNKCEQKNCSKDEFFYLFARDLADVSNNATDVLNILKDVR